MSRRKSSRGRVLVNAKGRKNYKNIAAFKQQIMADPKLNDLEKRAKLADLDDYIEQRVKNNRAAQKGWVSDTHGKLTTTGFEGFQEKDSLKRLFANVGMSAKEIADRYGFDEQELLDPDNWDNGVYLPAGKKFNFSYTGEIFDV